MSEREVARWFVMGKFNRRAFLRWGAGLAAALSVDGLGRTPAAYASVEEPTIAELQAAMASGRLSAHTLVAWYLARVEALDRRGPSLHSIIEINPDLFDIAFALDAERAAKGPRGPLHGIPILLKDNIDTADRMMTTAGSFALVGDPPSQDATVARKLREAGAILMGKANLSEWANFRSTNSRNGWSGRGGQTLDPYVLNLDPYGSSAGSAVAVAADLCTVALGSETDGSIVAPAAVNGVVGIKPTVGLTSRAGVIPISHSQDTIGPFGRTVADAAIVLGALTGVDPRDPATQASDGKSFVDYTQFLDPDGLKGARIGLPFGRGNTLTRAAVQALQDAGAVIVSPATIPRPPRGVDLGFLEYTVLLYEFKADLNAYLATRTGVPIRTLEDAIAFNRAHAAQELKLFGQEIFVASQKKGPLTDPVYLAALENSQRYSRQDGIDALMDKLQLDALVSPGLDGTDYAARAGYPLISVPAGFDASGLPINLMFMGRAYSEPTLIKLAYAFEQATNARRAPQLLATSSSGRWW
jgi:amidase